MRAELTLVKVLTCLPLLCTNAINGIAIKQSDSYRLPRGVFGPLLNEQARRRSFCEWQCTRGWGFGGEGAVIGNRRGYHNMT